MSKLYSINSLQAKVKLNYLIILAYIKQFSCPDENKMALSGRLVKNLKNMTLHLLSIAIISSTVHLPGIIHHLEIKVGSNK